MLLSTTLLAQLTPVSSCRLKWQRVRWSVLCNTYSPEKYADLYLRVHELKLDVSRFQSGSVGSRNAGAAPASVLGRKPSGLDQLCPNNHKTAKMFSSLPLVGSRFVPRRLLRWSLLENTHPIYFTSCYNRF